MRSGANRTEDVPNVDEISAHEITERDDWRGPARTDRVRRRGLELSRRAGPGAAARSAGRRRARTGTGPRRRPRESHGTNFQRSLCHLSRQHRPLPGRARRACSPTSSPRERRRVDRAQHPRRLSREGDGPVQGLADRPADLGDGRVPADADGQPQREAGLRPRSRRPGHHVGKADVQDGDRGAEPRDPLGPRVPARRPPADHRTPRPPADREERQAPSGSGQGHAEGLGETGRRAARRRGAPAVRAQRLDLSLVLGDAARLRRAAAPAASGRRRRRPRRRQGEADAAVRPIRRR